MKRSLILFLFALCFSFQIQAQKKNKWLNDSIVWRPDYKLVQEDFKGKIKSGAAGMAVTYILFTPAEVDGQIVYRIEAIFSKTKSALRNESKFMINHEQKHFDITEIHARKFRKKLAETNFLKVKNTSEKITDIYMDVCKEWNKEQEKYDKETEHSVNLAKQDLWDEKIVKELEELSAYAEIEVNIVKK